MKEILTCLMTIVSICVTISTLAQIPAAPKDQGAGQAAPKKKSRVEYPAENPVTKSYHDESAPPERVKRKPKVKSPPAKVERTTE
jgi:hypothetical protein